MLLQMRQFTDLDKPLPNKALQFRNRKTTWGEWGEWTTVEHVIGRTNQSAKALPRNMPVVIEITSARLNIILDALQQVDGYYSKGWRELEEVQVLTKVQEAKADVLSMKPELWIPISHNLPMGGDVVDVRLKDGSVLIGVIYDRVGGWKWQSPINLIQVIAYWRPNSTIKEIPLT